MNFLIYIILGIILVTSIVLFVLEDKNPKFYLPNGVTEVVAGTIIIDIICIIISGLCLIETTPYMIKKDNMKNVNQYESIIYELEHPEDYREIDIIHDVKEWNEDYNAHIYAHDNNIFWGILYPIKDLEGTYYIDINDYLEE